MSTLCDLNILLVSVERPLSLAQLDFETTLNFRSNAPSCVKFGKSFQAPNKQRPKHENTDAPQCTSLAMYRFRAVFVLKPFYMAAVNVTYPKYSGNMYLMKKKKKSDVCVFLSACAVAPKSHWNRILGLLGNSTECVMY